MAPVDQSLDPFEEQPCQFLVEQALTVLADHGGVSLRTGGSQTTGVAIQQVGLDVSTKKMLGENRATDSSSHRFQQPFQWQLQPTFDGVEYRVDPNAQLLQRRLFRMLLSRRT
ncbi:MAG TPA: hypothetical protein PJ981_13520 [Accumulibacter sp.]|nr:hypothetical protein [Accumulibacter sp.]HMY05708.1 hypothetical protein [Accumulibacter sp.]